jgi:hypothetical protein
MRREKIIIRRNELCVKMIFWLCRTFSRMWHLSVWKMDSNISEDSVCFYIQGLPFYLQDEDINQTAWYHHPVISIPNTVWISNSTALTVKAAKSYKWHISAACTPLWLPAIHFLFYMFEKFYCRTFLYIFLTHSSGSFSLHYCRVILRETTSLKAFII